MTTTLEHAAQHRHGWREQFSLSQRVKWSNSNGWRCVKNYNTHKAD